MSSTLRAMRPALHIPRLATSPMSTFAYSSLSLSPPSPSTEDAEFAARVAATDAFFKLPRFTSLIRPYTAADVASKQGSMPPLPLPSALTADKLWRLFQQRASEGLPVHTMGAVDPVQMTQMAPFQEVLYVSGWAASSLLTTARNEVGPDLGDYPYTTVPNQVERLFRAQQLHDRKHYDERLAMGPEARARTPYIDYLRPIVADADMGHGGNSTVMKLMKLFAEAGAAGVHLEDQLVGGKKCGHLSGKVLVPASTHVSRLIAARFQLDMLHHPMLLLARTDAESARLISSTVDVRDHPFIRGVATGKHNCREKPLAEAVEEAEARGAGAEEVGRIEAAWLERNALCTFDEAVYDAIQRSSVHDKEAMMKQYRIASASKSNTDARDIAKDILGEPVSWNWDLPKTREGYYHYTGGIDAAITRALAFAPYADMLWIETKRPDLNQARGFARNVRECFPDKWFVYNLSPSFNWSAQGFSGMYYEDLTNLVWELGKEGFLLQLISLAGLHLNATATVELAQRYKTDGMLAYVELVQRKEKELGCDVLTHQKWSGANYIDRILTTVSAGSSSTSAVGKDSTEHSF
ncbi:uncharacterized protein FIBRA_05797 [Fibroporia radiculosa]|uniref:Isocitrate lyase n=1 Tax=Fibroporia radiculosa TaxID=599839 RepID=J4GA44_9APHY|nr:uncharacterized protein FIBRA_05797 [Fibroporia radiculosa]CCM03653.1 predicted protein [Fibroporia radiculosa]